MAIAALIVMYKTSSSLLCNFGKGKKAWQRPNRLQR